MKKTSFLITFFLVFLYGCDSLEEELQEQSSVVVYLIDYTDNKFESGITFSVAKASSDYRALPVSVNIEEPSGNTNGSVSLTYTPTNLELLHAELSENGDSQIFSPDLLTNSDFFQLDDPIVLPGTVSIEDIMGPYQENFENTWEAISNLSVTRIFLDSDVLIGRFLYRPSENAQEEWKWVVILYNQ